MGITFKAPKWVVAGTAVAAVVALTAAGVVVSGVMGGGGPQPEDVMPANAMAFTKLDLNPSAGQKLAVFQLAAKFPKVKTKVTSQDTSIKESVFGSMFAGTGKDSLGLNFKKDVDPWLGDRIGVGVFPAFSGDKFPEIGIAIAYTDHDAAKSALDKVIAFQAREKAKAAANPPADFGAPSDIPGDSPSDVATAGISFTDPTLSTPTGYAFTKDGYVIVSDTTAHATKLAATGKATPLAASTRYSQDVKTLGEDQIGVAWADVAAVVKAIPKDQLDQLGSAGGGPLGLLQGKLNGANDPKKASGRVIMGLHADPSFVEVTGKAIELKGVKGATKTDPGTGAALIGSLPSQVFGAVSVTGLGKAVGALYTTVVKDDDVFQVKSMFDAMGITSGAQIETLLGAETGVMVGGTKDKPEFAIRTRGANPGEAVTIAQKVLDVVGPPALGDPGLPAISATSITRPDGLVVSMGDKLNAAIFDTSGTKLSSTPGFRQVVAGGPADFAAYINLATVIPTIPSDKPSDAAALKPFSAFGMTVSGGTVPTVRFRISVR
jgi:Protein of unknown function (DUF3352)